jgi:hypothetical protein
MKGYLVRMRMENQKRIEIIKNNQKYFDDIKSNLLNEASSKIAKFWRAKVTADKLKKSLR